MPGPERSDATSDDTFDQIAGSYHEVLDRGLASTGESSEYFARGRVDWLKQRIAGLGGTPPRRILDFGCGNGSAAPFLTDAFGPESLLGIDTSSASIEVARREHGSAEVAFRDARDYRPQADRDLAYCNGVFHHIPPAERAGAARSVLDSLRPGGIFALWENNPWNPGTRWIMNHCEFDQDAILVWPVQARRLLRDAGFDVLGTDFLFVFPKSLAALRPLERLAVRVPLGGQYQVLARRP